MEKKAIVQKLKSESSSLLDVAVKYYSLISVLNDLHLTNRQIQLLAFIAVKGNISSGGRKDEFSDMYGSSKASIGNILFKLGKKKLLVRENGVTKVNPAINLDFNNRIILQIQLDVL